MALKWAIQLITQIWKLINDKWIHCSKLKDAVESLDDHTKVLILDAKIIDEHERGQDTLPYHYNPYLSTPLSAILDTYITARKIGTASSRPLKR